VNDVAGKAKEAGDDAVNEAKSKVKNTADDWNDSVQGA
jgi:hypothetical protein